MENERVGELIKLIPNCKDYENLPEILTGPLGKYIHELINQLQQDLDGDSTAT